MESCGVGGGESRKRGRAKDGGAEGDEPEAKRFPLVPWAQQQPPHPASRIYRVSRASGGKDRHSKVYTAKGIRDRRVRLSVATAIQFYDLQDRLGYDQPSKAIEWLIKAAADAIDKLPELHNSFPSHPASALAAASNKDKADKEAAASGSGCSSTSETSKGSVLSLSRSENRVKARERARERSAAAKDGKDPADDAARPAPTSSFTELLTGMSGGNHKQPPPPTSSWTTADYIGFAQHQPPRKPSSTLPQTFASPVPHLTGGTIPPPAAAQQQQQHFGLSAAVTVAAQPNAEMPTHFSFLQQQQQQQDHHHFMSAAAGGDYNLNFSMSPGGGGGLVMGVNSRGTLQSNSSPQISSAHHQLQRLSPLEAAPNNNIPFIFTPAPADTQFAAAFQLWNGFHHHAAPDIKDKAKN